MGPCARTLLALASVCAIGAAACGDDDARRPGDAGADVELDGPTSADAAPPRDGGREAAPSCDPACDPSDRCCGVGEGAALCVDPRTSEEHCGRCGIACADGRGTECVAGFCVCGASAEGCSGTRRDTCCPGPSGAQPRCRNLDIDPESCGACGVACDPRRALSCRNGRCECGDLMRECEGTAGATCCLDSVGIALCRDLTRDNGHCGACNNACPFGFRCLSGVCSLDGEPCPSGCAFPDACCRGECCDPSLCRADGCIGT